MSLEPLHAEIAAAEVKAKADAEARRLRAYARTTAGKREAMLKQEQERLAAQREAERVQIEKEATRVLDELSRRVHSGSTRSLCRERRKRG